MPSIDMFLVSACRTGKSPLVAGKHIEGVFRLVGISDATFGKESQSFLQQFSCVFFEVAPCRYRSMRASLICKDAEMRKGSMASERQRAANRANAKRSTGPKNACRQASLEPQCSQTRIVSIGLLAKPGPRGALFRVI